VEIFFDGEMDACPKEKPINTIPKNRSTWLPKFRLIVTCVTLYLLSSLKSICIEQFRKPPILSLIWIFSGSSV